MTEANSILSAPLTISQASEKIGAFLSPQIPPEKKPDESTDSMPIDDQNQSSMDTPDTSEEIPATTEIAHEESDHTSAEELPQTISEAAERLGIPYEQFKNLKVRVKVDGIESEVPFEEVAASYQTQKHVTQKSMEVSEAKKHFEAANQELLQQRQNIEKALAETNAALQIAQQQLFEDFSAENWQELKQTRPDQWAARQIEFAQRQARLEEAKQKMFGEISKQQAEFKAQQEKQLVERLRVEQQALYQKLPHWKDEAKRNTERVELTGFLQKAGFSSEELSNVSDHRLLVIAHKALLYDKQQQLKPTIEKKVAALPKVMKGGRPQTEGEVKAHQKAQKFAALKQTGSLHAAADLIGDLIRPTRK